MNFEELCALFEANPDTCVTQEMLALMFAKVCELNEGGGEDVTACNATLLTQAQVDSADFVKILACLSDGTIGAITADMLGGSVTSGEVVYDGGGVGCITLPSGDYYVTVTGGNYENQTHFIRVVDNLHFTIQENSSAGAVSSTLSWIDTLSSPVAGVSALGDVCVFGGVIFRVVKV